MQVDIDLLQTVPLFGGIERDKLAALFACVGAKKETYQKGEFISLSGDTLKNIGIVLTGQVQIIKEDVFGNRAILNNLDKGSVFGESFVCGGNYALTISIQANENASVLFLAFDRIMNMCPSACDFHNALIKNMVTMVARKNVKLLERLEISTKRTLREKILTYLSLLAQEQNSLTVTSPLGRVDFADFLSVDRSALTRELNRMKEEQLISFDKNIFTLLYSK